jgi:hypothetical protein
VSAVCPDGHPTTSSDYCDVCGLPVAGSLLGGAATAAPPVTGGGRGAPFPPAPTAPGGPATAVKTCPNCNADAPPTALFCEDCGYDFTTGALPPPPESNLTLPMSAGPAGAPGGTGGQPLGSPADGGSGPVTVEWVAEMWVDPDWYATQDTNDPCPSPGMPAVIPLTGRSLLVGRRSVSRNITPQIDCGTDSGVSRRHAQLTTDGQRWWVEDLQSANGTYVGQAGGPLPNAPLSAGQKTEFAPGDRIYLGAWTRIVVRRATEGEI